MPVIAHRTDDDPPPLEVGDVLVAEDADDALFEKLTKFYPVHGVKVMRRWVRNRIIIRRIEG